MDEKTSSQHDDFIEEDELNFSELKGKVKSFFRKRPAKQQEEEFSIDIKGFWNQHKRWLLPVLLIAIAIGFSTYFRMQASSLPVTERWADNTVTNFYQTNVRNQVEQQYPNLPAQNKDALVERQWQEFREQNKKQIEGEIHQVSEQYKAQFKDENGETYLLAIDPYLWYSLTKNVVEFGHTGDKIIDGRSHFSLRDGRLDKLNSKQLHPYIAAYLYKFLHFFNPSMTVMRTLFLLPMIIINLSLIPAFFITRKIAGNIGGFFAAMFVAVNGALLGRTPAGFADTDPYNVFFPLLITWIFLEAYTAGIGKKKSMLGIAGGVLCGILLGIYTLLWSGWSFILLFILAALLLTLIYHLLGHLHEHHWKIRTVAGMRLLRIKTALSLLVSIFISSWIFVTLFSGKQKTFWNALSLPLHVITLKEAGVRSIWPNVLTTVAEFNTVSLPNIISQMGGNFLFWISTMGIVLLLVSWKETKKRDVLYLAGSALYFALMIGYKERLTDPLAFMVVLSIPIIIGILKTLYYHDDVTMGMAILLILWFAGAIFAFSRGIRFSLLLTPAFAIALGVALGYVFIKTSAFLHRHLHVPNNVGKILLFGLLCLLFINPLARAEDIAGNLTPSFNDGWHGALISIQEDSEDSIITSWWDFGHWFAAIAERRVTFDGGDQGERIHWVGKTLLTSNEEEAIGILRMLNCAQETAPHKLDEFTGNSLTSLEMLYTVFPLKDRTEAYQKYLDLGLTKEQAVTMLEYTHCKDLLPNYFITSQDMVGKAGVWGHFGSWNFERATMYRNTKNSSRQNAVAYLTSTFGLTEQDANRIHNEIQTTQGDQWISPWPSYITGFQPCERQGEALRCTVGVQGRALVLFVDLNTYTITSEGNTNATPNSLVYATNESVVEKKFEGNKMGFSAVLMEENGNYAVMLTAPEQAASMFTRLFFFNGKGLQCFSPFDDRRDFTGLRIATWKANFECTR